MPFAATAIVAPSDVNGELQLHILNPLSQKTFLIPAVNQVATCEIPLAWDTTAPLAYLNGEDRLEFLQGFLRPDRFQNDAELVMMHPHHPRKIPVVFVHGLASDPKTWVPMVNELSVDSEIKDQYEFWAFYYATGRPFPVEAAAMRQQLQEARGYIDPTYSDPSLDKMVLVGHSMGGLVSKLQVNSSGNAVANSLQLPVKELQSLTQEEKHALYWQPVSSVQRVIFMATPHHGSELASRPIGRFASSLVRFDSSSLGSFGNLYGDSLSRWTQTRRQLPTAIDLLEPSNPTLNAIAGLPISPAVSTHSIIGYGHNCCFAPPGDGVVPLTSSRIPGVESELLIRSGHEVHTTPQAINEVKRILREHAAVAWQVENDPQRHETAAVVLKAVQRPE
ncbi:esterase/lipase family protein [Rhodopirellula sp. P2]|uniref:esterase/lipase family protein n=1 Tax=Rhodopirellula sp. P2 TaxID=2127060 RepID=UPI0023680403|nr:alpha/beta fold hydrolase [Rhodopirellula sp. P2]WDQ18504.1 alpha/beta fold hydrolase [Rhodopirellula sp. P2]